MATRYADLPSPPAVPLLGHAPIIMADPAWEVFARWARLGRLVRLSLPPNDAVLLSDPAAIDALVAPDAPHAYKGITRVPFDVPGADDPFNAAGGADWARRRHAHPLSRSAATAWIAGLGRPIQQTFSDLVVAGAQAYGSIDLWAALRRAVHDALAMAWLGRLPDDAAFACYEKLTHLVQVRLFLDLGLGPDNTGVPFDDALFGQWHAALMDAMPSTPPPGTFLALMADLGMADSNKQAAHRLMAACFAGGMSTASTLASALHLLGRRRDVLDDLRDALAALPVRDGVIEPAALAGCAPLDRVVRETLRMRPPVPITGRNTAADRTVTVAGVELPPNTIVFYSAYVAQRDHRHWRDPHRFDPARWTPTVMVERPYGSDHFFPFGRGRRSCLGQALALQIIRVGLATMALDGGFDLEPAEALDDDWFFACLVPDRLDAVVYGR